MYNFYKNLIKEAILKLTGLSQEEQLSDPREEKKKRERGGGREEEERRRREEKKRRREERRGALCPRQGPDNGSEWLRTAVTGTVKAHRPLSNGHVILLTRRYE